MAALVILGLFSSAMMTVINGCTAWAANSAMRMQAFEVARDNMEELLSQASVEERNEEGESEKYPEITWQTAVETFYEPVSNRMWARAVCSAQYEDADGEEQTVELEHWLTNISKEQLLQIMKRDDEGQDGLSGQVFETIEEAALYAGVDEETIAQWIENGMKVLPDGSIPKDNLDLFKEYDGNPPPEIALDQIETPEELTPPEEPGQNTDGQEPSDDSWLDEVDPTTGMTYREIEANEDEFWKRVMEILNSKG